jgi:deazaflavin-dependent oxidoreductase (nitroreductase family)
MAAAMHRSFAALGMTVRQRAQRRQRNQTLAKERLWNPLHPLFEHLLLSSASSIACSEWLWEWAGAFRTNYLLQVRGRKSGKIYSTPIDLLVLNGTKFLVAPRGRAQWVRNAEAAGEVVLKKGKLRQSYKLRAVSDQEKPAVLKAYLDQFKREVQGYFPVPAGSGVEAFQPLVGNYPAFELLG